MSNKIVKLRAHRLAVTASTEVAYSDNDLLHLALQQQAALVGTPAAAGLRTPVFAQGRDLPQVLRGMIKVQQFMHLLRCQA